MAIDFESVLDGAGAVFHCSGKLTGGELHQSNAKAYCSEAAIRKLRFFLIDASGADSADITMGELSRCAFQDYRASRINPDIVTAVVSSSDVAVGLMRMWLFLMKHGDVSLSTKLFSDKQSALAWIEEMTGLQYL